MNRTAIIASTVVCASMTALAAAVKIQMPPSCTNPDGMAVDPAGRLVIATPNNDHKQPGAIFLLDSPDSTPRKWFDVPAHPESGYAAPMGICFGSEGEMYVCDNQKKTAKDASCASPSRTTGWTSARRWPVDLKTPTE